MFSHDSNRIRQSQQPLARSQGFDLCENLVRNFYAHNFKLSEFIFHLFFLLPVSGTDRANGPNNPEIPDWTENEFGNDCHHGYGSRDRLGSAFAPRTASKVLSSPLLMGFP